MSDTFYADMNTFSNNVPVLGTAARVQDAVYNPLWTQDGIHSQPLTLVQPPTRHLGHGSLPHPAHTQQQHSVEMLMAEQLQKEDGKALAADVYVKHLHLHLKPYMYMKKPGVNTFIITIENMTA